MAFIKRQLEQVLQNRLFKGKALIVIGARQVGKSTLFQQLISQLPSDIDRGQILQLNCDDPETRAMLTNMNLSEIRTLVANNKVILIDEAQRVQGIGLTLKMITDNFPQVQLLVTGSSSFMLQNELNEPLTGRKFEYHLYPISTCELLNDGGLLRAKQTLESRLIYGSYPDVFNNQDDMRTILANISGSYLYQDLLSLEGVRKPALLEKLLIALALQVGSEVSFNELAQTVGTDSKTVEKYVDLLEKCYVVFHLSALSRNVRTELKKSKKYYFYDNGIRNALIQNLNPINLRQDMGALWENFIISERLKFNHYTGRYVNSYFWRTTTQQEIDYVEEFDGAFTVFEMKWNPKKAKTQIPTTFLNSYKVREKAVVTPENYLQYLC